MTKFKTASLLIGQGGGRPLLFPLVFDTIPIVERDCIQNSGEGYSQDTHAVDTQNRQIYYIIHSQREISRVLIDLPGLPSVVFLDYNLALSLIMGFEGVQ